ncbi:DUF2075 domain-containing protein [Alteromonadaceae bacterium M269]|nr:DUF2075 domain-containing protein [Alteromonadaceae bacterium M269]
MAIMYPDFGPKDNDSPVAEPLIYSLLKEQLGDDFHVIHSLPWLSSFVMDFHESSSPIGEIDFLILHEELGILAIEAKGGKRIRHDKNGFYYLRNSDDSVARINPLHQLRRGVFAIQKWLKEKGITVKIGAAYYFPEISTESKSLPFGYFNTSTSKPISYIIDINHNSNLRDRIIEIMTFFRGYLNANKMSHGQILQLINMILPTEDYAPCWLSRINNDNYLWLRLTPEQKNCVEEILVSQRYVLNGWPGSGKTLIAVQVARALSERGEKSLVVTFNRLMAEKLEKELAEHPGCHVRNIHALCRDAAGFIKNENTFSREWMEEGAFEDLKLGIDEGFLDGYDNLIVDEGQVIREQVWDMFIGAFNTKKIVVMCDAFQVLEYEKSVDISYLESVLSVSAFTLTNSLRMPKQVCDRLRLFNKPNYAVHNPRAVEQDTLLERVVPNQQDALIRLLDQLISDNIPLSYITVLTPTYMSISTELVPQGVSVESIGRFRGLEKPIVIIVADKRMSEVEFFCGYSRATSKCIVLLDAFDVKNGAYGRLGADIYQASSAHVEQEASKSLTSQIVKTADIQTVPLFSTLPLYWSESWHAYVLMSGGHSVTRALFEAYLATHSSPKIFTWSEVSRKTLSLISEEVRELDDNMNHENYELKGCLTCGGVTPHSMIYSDDTSCYKCCHYSQVRDESFEAALHDIDMLLKTPHSYTPADRKQVDPFIYAIGGLVRFSKKYNTKAVSFSLASQSKIIGKLAIAFVILYFVISSNRGKYTVKVSEVTKEAMAWNSVLNDLTFNSWQGHVNDAFNVLQRHQLITFVGSGMRSFDSRLISEQSNT